MSDLKYQLRRLLPTLSGEAKQLKDPEARERLYLLKKVATSSKPIETVCNSKGRSKGYFYEWGARLLEAGSVLALVSKSRKPKSCPHQTTKRVEKKIRKLRVAEPYQGPERISQDLMDLYKIKCPPSTVYSVLRRLNLITKESQKSLTKKHLKRYRRPMPGYLQMDFKYVPYLINGKQLYQLSCIDHHSSWRHIRLYKNKNQTAVVEFLNELKDVCPFPIFQLQTDNDAAFTDKYRINSGGLPSGLHPVDLWCAKHDIEHRLIPIGQKELNGKVENTHKQDDREHFSGPPCVTFEALKRATEGYNLRWNETRKTKALNWLTPTKTIELAFVRAMVFMQIFADRYPHASLVKLDHDGVAYLPTNEQKPKSKKKKAKRDSLLTRYLKTQEWIEKRKRKLLTPLFPISLSYSIMNLGTSLTDCI